MNKAYYQKHREKLKAQMRHRYHILQMWWKQQTPEEQLASMWEFVKEELER